MWILLLSWHPFYPSWTVSLLLYLTIYRILWSTNPASTIFSFPFNIFYCVIIWNTSFINCYHSLFWLWYYEWQDFYLSQHIVTIHHQLYIIVSYLPSYFIHLFCQMWQFIECPLPHVPCSVCCTRFKLLLPVFIPIVLFSVSKFPTTITNFVFKFINAIISQ